MYPQAQPQKSDPITHELLFGNPKNIPDAQLLHFALSYNSHPNQKLNPIPLKKIKQLLKNLYSLDLLISYPLDQFLNEGFHPKQVALLKATFEIGNRAIYQSHEPLTVIHGSYDVFNYLYPAMKSLKKEIFKLLILNSQNQITHDISISYGSVDSVPVYVREIMEFNLKYQAVSFIIVHNHPSGNVDPSYSDELITQKLFQAGQVMDIPFSDHIIIGSQQYYSFLDQGFFSH